MGTRTNLPRILDGCVDKESKYIRAKGPSEYTVDTDLLADGP